MANAEHSGFVAKALARTRWHDESRWREVILEAEEFIDCYFAARAWSPPQDSRGWSGPIAEGRGYDTPPKVESINPTVVPGRFDVDQRVAEPLQKIVEAETPQAPEMAERVARAMYVARRGRIILGTLVGNLDDWPPEYRASYYADARAAIEAMRGPTDKMIEAMAFQIAIRAGSISPAKWETMPDVHKNAQEGKGFWRGVAISACKEGIDVALGE